MTRNQMALNHFVVVVVLLFRKNAVEMELAKCRMDMMSLNSQLLDAIQQKLNLSQQLEAWQVGGRGSQGQVYLTHRVLLLGSATWA